MGFTLAAISLPFWDGLSNIPCQCSGKSNMYPKHVHDTLGDKWRVHNNYLVDYILIHAPKGHHRKSGRSYRIRFSWDVHFLRKNSCDFQPFPSFPQCFSENLLLTFPENPNRRWYPAPMPDLPDKTSPPGAKPPGRLSNLPWGQSTWNPWVAKPLITITGAIFWGI